MDIKEIRDRIDAIDNEMAELFVRRMAASGEVADFKMERGLPIEDAGREQQVIEKHASMIENEEIRSLYINFQQNLMEISKRWQHRLMNGMRVACAGTPESAGHEAAKAIFPDGNTVIYVKCKEAYKAVEKGECDVAVLPVENSYSGELGKVYDLIFSGELFVNDIYAVEGPESTTRYAVLSRIESEPATGSEFDSFLIMFTVKDEIGGLAKAINLISAYDFNMRVMRSRPMSNLPWHYYFYAELEGDCSDENRARLMRGLSAACPFVKIAGRFTADRFIPAGEQDK